MIEVHGRSGSWARVSAVTWLAASPAISTARTRAKSSISSVSRSVRSRPRAKRIAESSASARCCSRTRSRGFILDLGLAQHLVAKIAAEVLGGAYIHPPSCKQTRELLLDFREVEKARPGFVREFDQQVDIAVRSRRPLQRGAEQGQTADMPPAAQRR